MIRQRRYIGAEGPYMLSAIVQFDEQCKESLDGWYMRVRTVDLIRQLNFEVVRIVLHGQVGGWLDRREDGAPLRV